MDLGRTVAVALLVYAVSEAFTIALGVVDVAILAQIDPKTPLGFFDAIPDATGVTEITGLARLLLLVVYLVTAFLTLKWVYRASRNAHAFRRGLPISPPWSVGWFFVPIAFLWKPFAAMSQTWRVSTDPEAWVRASVPSLMRWWWGFWLASILIGNMSFQIARRVPTVGGLTVSTVFEVVSAAAGIAAALALRRLVVRLSALQTNRINTQVF